MEFMLDLHKMLKSTLYNVCSVLWRVFSTVGDILGTLGEWGMFSTVGHIIINHKYCGVFSVS